MVSKQNEENTGSSAGHTEIITEETENTLNVDENEDSNTRNDNYTYTNEANARNLDNTLLLVNSDTVVTENGGSDYEREVDGILIMENDAENNVAESSIQCTSGSQDSNSVNNITQASLNDTKLENNLRKNFKRCLENRLSNAKNSHSDATGEQNGDLLADAESIDSSSGQGTSFSNNSHKSPQQTELQTNLAAAEIVPEPSSSDAGSSQNVRILILYFLEPYLMFGFDLMDLDFVFSR